MGTGRDVLSEADAAYIREAAAAEWDASVPRWAMPRDKFIEWHVWCARKALSRRSRRP